MFPKWHILLGGIFSLILFFFFNVNLFNSLIIFLSSVLIDFDHYIWYINRKKDWSLKKAYLFHKNLPKNHKPIMHILHTIEFLFLVFILAYFWQGFLFILIGMLFHSILDLIEIIYDKRFSCREFSLINYLLSDKREYF